MITEKEFEIAKKMDAADYTGFLRDSEAAESVCLLVGSAVILADWVCREI